MNKTLLLTLLLFLGCKDSDFEKNKIITNNVFHEFVKEDQYIHDSISFDFNQDAFKDYILVLDDTSKRKSGQHQSPILILIIQGTKNGFNLLSNNISSVDELGSNCPAEGYQDVGVNGKSFKLTSTICIDNFYFG